MFRWISDTGKAVWFFLKFAVSIVLGYLLLLGAMWVLRQLALSGLKQSSAAAWEVMARLETVVMGSGLFFLITWGLHFLDRYIFRQGLLKRGRIFSKGPFPLLTMFTFPFFHEEEYWPCT